ncbi:D-alanyl-D-alanine carboxypeptidase family protein [Pararhodobacter marinus]|uniref:D-alanyl-D-alanine carboxypeptidase family protein n=1 Tax=Pararhodobacter marinus TaxID=2184063 RepID=UPI0035122AD1
MTTHTGRWFRGFGILGFATVLVVLMALGVPNRAHAQPYAGLLMDVRTGEILYQTDNANARLHPASLTKMMTLYIAFEALENGEIDADARVRISSHAAAQPPSRLGLRSGQEIAFRYLIRAAALRSGNDAAVAIAEALEGSVSAFADRMNRTARAIGMTRTHFVNPHGLTASGHLSSAHDMALLARQLYFDHPAYYNIFSRMSDNAGIATVRNTNRLFLSSYRGADGIKTGFTNAAGYNLAAMAERNGVRMLAVVFGARSSPDRLRRVSALLDRGFRDAPRSVATRRPARPDYVRGADDRGGGVAAGRTIRLQTAPARSIFPRPRPGPDEAPPAEMPAEMIAALRDGIDEVLDDVLEPETGQQPVEVAAAVDEALAIAREIEEGGESGDPAMADSEDAVDAETTAETMIAAIAPQASPVPPARPAVDVVQLVQDETETADNGTDHGVEVARAGTSAVDASIFAALAEAGSATPDIGPVGAATETTSGDGSGPEPRQFDHDPDSVSVAEVTSDGLVIPGLPPISVPEEGARGTEAARPPEPARAAETALAAASPAPAMPALPQIEPVAQDLSVDDEGRILWRDEELLVALDGENPEDPVLQPTIVLTSSLEDTPDEPEEERATEVITRVSTSGGRLWRVELGRFGSAFEADRVLLSVALSEAATLGNGVLRVVPRGGRHVAEVNSLTEQEAELACLRLAARNQTCNAYGPQAGADG